MSIIAYANPITGKTISKAKTAPPPWYRNSPSSGF